MTDLVSFEGSRSGMDFWGQFDHKIDSKGRLNIPGPFRAAFEDGGFVVCRGNYIAVMTAEKWFRNFRRFEDSGEYDPVELQLIASLASPFQPDAQSRLVIAPKLRAHSGLTEEITIVGAGTHLAIYDREEWERVERGRMQPSEGLSVFEKMAKVPVR